MERVNLEDVRSDLDALVERVERGEEIVIARDGRAVAKLSAAAERSGADEIIARFRALRERMAADGVRLSWEELKEMRDEGRP